MKKIGIYSGTFDPVHAGHIGFATEAIRQCGLDKVFFLVEPRPRRKQGVKALEHRYNMVNLAIADKPKLGSILLGQQRFTPAGTLPVLQNRFQDAQLFMLMGDDMLSHFADWPNVELLVKNVSFIIGLRKYDEAEMKNRLRTIEETKGFKLNYKFFVAPEVVHASRKIRSSIKLGKQTEGLSKKVAKYIADESLYASSNEGS